MNEPQPHSHLLQGLDHLSVMLHVWGLKGSCVQCSYARSAVQTVRYSLSAVPADLLPDNPYDTMNQGCDFLRNHQSPSIDFATIHLWPDSWLTSVDDERRIQFARRWINCHVDVCTQLLNKPLVLAEFGWKIDGRAAYYDKVRGNESFALICTTLDFLILHCHAWRTSAVLKPFCITRCGIQLHHGCSALLHVAYICYVKAPCDV